MSAPAGSESVSHLRARDWRVDTVAQSDAARLIRAWHYAHGASSIAVYRHGLFPADELVPGDAYGVALWLPPTRPAAESVSEDWQGVLALSRLVIAPGMPTNAASFLLGRSMRLVDRTRWPVLLTYADTAEGHTGAIYKATNWTCLGEMRGHPRFVNTAGVIRGPKRGLVNLTYAELESRGFVRQTPQPKIKFVHVVRPRRALAERTGER